MWNRKTVAVIFPTYKEKSTLFNSIQDFDSTGYVDEIIVVDNNTEDGIQIEVKRTRARYIKEPRVGYGRAIKTGVKNTKADLIIFADPDGTYAGKDAIKLLAYSDDFDAVFGSRTHIPLIGNESDMTFIRRVLDVFCGKLITLLFLTSPLSDVICTLSLYSSKSLKKQIENVKTDGHLFTTRLLLEIVMKKIRFIEIPVNYKVRVGVHRYTNNFLKQAYWGIRVFLLIINTWLSNLLTK
ncbi:MAG: glycosyltransferase family 2 protein [Candidatus Daviesbacteria bacterium]|nr:glycosyltransferase family 2 protein [Candidatus Daviesbacteria bacterium]